MIKAVIFDLGGVILPENINSVSKRAAKELGFDLGIFTELRKKHNHGLMTGKKKFAEVIDALRKKANLRQSTEEILAIWERAYFDVLPVSRELLKVIKKLRKKYAVAMLSNIYDFTAASHRHRGIFEVFDPCVLSCEVGLEKPDERIFRLAVEKLSLEPGECIFIDDKASNCDAAQKFGFNSILFKNNQQLFAGLKKFGVVVE